MAKLIFKKLFSVRFLLNNVTVTYLCNSKVVEKWSFAVLILVHILTVGVKYIHAEVFSKYVIQN